MLQDIELPYQLVPPNNHRRNLSERSTQTHKNHLMSGISGAHPDFPLILWDTFIKQAKITINWLCASRINSKLSACAQLFGIFNYDATPLALPGCKFIVYKNLMRKALGICIVAMLSTPRLQCNAADAVKFMSLKD